MPLLHKPPLIEVWIVWIVNLGVALSMSHLLSFKLWKHALEELHDELSYHLNLCTHK